MTSGSLPRISIITVTFNAEKFIEKTIKSVINLDYSNYEYIIIDGGSKDNTVDIIGNYKSQIDILISEKDKGIYDAMNKGILLSSGKWVNFMNAGDTFYSRESLSFFKEIEEDADIFYGDAIMDYGSTKKKFPIYPIKKIWKYSPFCHQAAFIKSRVLKEHPYDLKYPIGADHELFYYCYVTNRVIKHVDEVICNFHSIEGTTKRNIIQAVRDKRDISLYYEPNRMHALYYYFFLIYIRMNKMAKVLNKSF
ncbi:MAG: glycosyltransferase family 2 protein [Bacteroidota bacterium]